MIWWTGWMDGLDSPTFQCNHPVTVTSSFGQDCYDCGWTCMLLVILLDDDSVREDRKVVEHPESDQQPEQITDDVRGIRENGF